MFIRVHLDSLDMTEGNSTFESVSTLQLWRGANIQGLDLKLEENSLSSLIFMGWGSTSILYYSFD